MKQPRLVVRVTPSLHDRVRAISEKYHVNVSGIIKTFITEWVERFEKDPEIEFLKTFHDGNVNVESILKNLIGDVESIVTEWVMNQAATTRK